MRRSVPVVLAAAALTGGPAWLPATAEGARALTYSIERLDVPGRGHPEFRRIVRATLDDPRGWSLGGRLRFRELRRGGELTITLASPAAVQRFAGCSAFYSCRAGDRVLINAERWRRGTDSYSGRGRLHAYRQMVINHEVGHALGFGHVDCRAPGALAAVMQQQSKGLRGCRRNPWPLKRERHERAARAGVAAPPPPRPISIGRRLSHVELGERPAAVRARLGAPVRRARLPEGTRVDSYSLPRIDVSFARGRVSAVTSRSRADVTPDGLAAGRRLTAALRGRCAATAAGGRRCEIMVGEQARARTTALVRDGRIVALQVAGEARRWPSPSHPSSRPARTATAAGGWCPTTAAQAPLGSASATGRHLDLVIAPFALEFCAGHWSREAPGAVIAAARRTRRPPR